MHHNREVLEIKVASMD